MSESILDYEPLAVTVPLSPEAAQSQIREALSAEGFVTARLHVTDGCRAPGCDVLIAHCPRLTRIAIAMHGHVRAAVPTTVLIAPNGTGTVIEASDPITTVDLADNPTLFAIVIDARCRIQRALATLQWSADAHADVTSAERPRTAVTPSNRQ